MKAHYAALLAAKYREINLNELGTIDRILWKHIYPRIIQATQDGLNEYAFSTVIAERLVEKLVKDGYTLIRSEKDHKLIVRWDVKP